MWQARNKTDLIIEVWEKLDCESIGRAEIEAIETAVEAHYGESAVDPPMAIARLLADEGAELRHAEIMQLHVDRISERPFDAAFRDLLKIETLAEAEETLRRLTELRARYLSAEDKKAVRFVLDTARRGREQAGKAADKKKDGDREVCLEIVQWFNVWIQNPEIFEDWLALRKASGSFRDRFENVTDNAPVLR